MTVSLDQLGYRLFKFSCWKFCATVVCELLALVPMLKIHNKLIIDSSLPEVCVLKNNVDMINM